MQRRPATASHTRRSICAALVAVAGVMLLSLLALRSAPHVDPDGVNHGHTTVVAKAAPSRVVAMARTPAPLPFTATLLVGAVTIAGAARWARGRTPLGLQRHRIDDDGDDWRALLRGAPPALA
jgi:hypothetical protein